MKTNLFTQLRKRPSALFPALALITLSAPSLFAATGIWNGTVGGGDGFWDATANTEWTGLTGNAWDATNGPNNVAQFNSGIGANIGTAGVPVANGIIWNGVAGGISSGGVKLDGTNPFISVSSGLTSSFFANLTGTNGFTKTGAGTVTLDGGGGVKGITGGFTVSQGGLRLTLGASANTANSSNTLNLSGSNLEVFNNGTQTLSTFTLGNGGSRIVITPNGAANSTTLSLANWTKASNSSVVIDLSATGTAKTVNLTGTLPTVTNSLIGGYATVRDSSTTYGFATLDGSNNVVRYTGATVVSSALGADTVSTTNYQATAAGTWFNGSGTTQTLNSLEIAVAGTVSGNNAATYVLNSGGLLFSNTSNTTNGGQANMTFTSATSELQIATVQYNNGFAVPSVKGVTDNGGTSVSLIKAGTGGLNMATGTFSYTGDTIVNEGILYNVLNIPSGTGKGNLVVNSRGIVTIGVATSGTRTINGLSNTTFAGGTVNNQNFTSTAATSFLNLGNNNATASFSGVITGAFGIIKSGTGTQTFSGANNYTGTTSVNAGTLLVNGSISGSTTTTVASGGTLGGTGSVGAVNINSGGTLAPGNGIESLATGALSLNSGSTFAFQLNNDAAPGVAADLVAITGALTLDIGNTANLTLAELGAGAWTEGEKLTLFSYTGAWNGGLFSFGSAVPDDSTISFGGTNWTFNYNDTAAGTNFTADLTGSNYVTITAIPEPGTVSLLGGMAVLALLRRRRA